MDHVASIEGSPQNKPLEQHQKNELYLETANVIRQTMGEAAATSYLQNNEHYSFGPTGEAVNPLAEMHNMPVVREYNNTPFMPPQNEQPVQPFIHGGNVVDMKVYRRRRDTRQTAEYATFPQGPETGPFATKQLRRRLLGRIGARFSKGERRAS